MFDTLRVADIAGIDAQTRSPRDRRFQRQQNDGEEQPCAQCPRADCNHSPLTHGEAGVPQFERVHGRALAPVGRICTCASMFVPTGVDDWISAAKPCLTTDCEICESVVRLGAVTFMSKDSSR